MLAKQSGEVMEDSTFSVMHRLQVDGANITQALVSAIEYQIFPVGSTTAHTTATALTPGNVVFDTLQTDGRWTADSTGYNFRHDIGAGVLTDPTQDYEIEYKFTLTAGETFYVRPPVIEVIPVKSS